MAIPTLKQKALKKASHIQQADLTPSPLPAKWVPPAPQLFRKQPPPPRQLLRRLSGRR